MMLRALADLAAREGLVPVHGHERRPVDFEIALDLAGRLVSLIDRRGQDGRGKELVVPRIPGRTLAVVPGLLVDNSKYVLGVDPKAANAERSKRCVEAFARSVRELAVDVSDPAVVAVTQFYDHLDQHIEEVLADRGIEAWTGSEVVLFSVDGLGLVHERELVRDWIVRRSRRAATSGRSRCMVSGRFSTTTRLHPAIKRVPGAQAMGAMLVSFNAEAFSSQGLGQGENAPMSQDAAIAYSSALNYLLERPSSPKRRHRYGVSLGEESVACYWTTAPTCALSFFDAVWNDPTAEVELGSEHDRERFYVVTLSGNAARVIVRGMFESTLGQVRENVDRYAGDLAIGLHPTRHSIRQLISALAPPGHASAPPELAARVFASSVDGQPLPREILRHALLRLRTGWTDGPGVSAARMALIKATLRGSGRDVTRSLKESSCDPAYHLGRLFAALEKAQLNALGEMSSTIRDRHFGAASTTPATAFPSLLRAMPHHLERARDLRRDVRIASTIATIMERLPSAAFASVHALEDQGLFAVGYYHQRETFSVRKAS